MRSFRAVAALVSLVVIAACSSPTATPPPPAGPTLACHAPITLDSPDNAPIPVPFSTPIPTGGQAPVSVTCTPPGGSAFPVGTTTVSCTATDALQRTSTCTSTVTIRPAPQLSKTRFLAFGDSITFGRCNGPDTLCAPYTIRLRQLLEARYTRQSFTVIESGRPGENASDDISPSPGNVPGQDRLPDELMSYAPEVLLLMEGTNDLINGHPSISVNLAEIALEQMVQVAQQRGVTVLLATIPPQRYPPPPGTRDRTGSGVLVVPLNERIRAIAARRNAILVDIYAAMNADLAGTIGIDNLHPTEKGLAVIADTFYAAIRQALEVQ